MFILLIIFLYTCFKVYANIIRHRLYFKSKYIQRVTISLFIAYILHNYIFQATPKSVTPGAKSKPKTPFSRSKRDFADSFTKIHTNLGIYKIQERKF